MFCAGAVLAGQLLAQAPVRLAKETPFLKEPGGVRLATLSAGLRFTPARTSGEYVEVTLQGWIFSKSLKSEKRDGFDVSVNASAGENVRVAPDGAVLARAVDGALFLKRGGRAGWTEVRRAGWVPRSALVAPVAKAAPPKPVTPKPVVAKAASAPTPVPAASPAPPTAPPPAARTATLRAGAAIQRSPDGATVATLAGPTEVTVVEHDRDWARVRLEGWVRQSDVDSAVALRPAITAAMLRDNPERFVGQNVEWRLQFLAHQQADELRPEMPLGHPYLLARGPLPEAGFVYVMVSKEQAERLQGLKPLDELVATVTVRAGRTRYLATPVVELVRLGDGR